ncbi:MAG TPA: hypothetical protein PKY55_02350 [bacterium]|nr:hypothetical protein [bacterium]
MRSVQLDRTIILLTLICVVEICVFPSSAVGWVKTRVNLTQGGYDVMRNGIGDALSRVLQEANKISENVGDIQNIRDYCTAEGFDNLKTLIMTTGLFTMENRYDTNLLVTADRKKYEVRNLNVRVKMGDTKGSPIQELVFQLDYRGIIIDARFAIEMNHYQDILTVGQKLKDAFYRQQVLNFLEQYRTAHNRKDIVFLERTYSNDALIIVGSVLKPKKNEDTFQFQGLGDSTIQFIKLSKQEYISRLRSVFQKNSFVKILFDSVEVIQHPKNPKIYGITVKQRWNSSTYSDTGYLFIMMDFRNEDQPLIRVRSWQPQRFRDGSIVGIGDFFVDAGD